jgi:hypothetical protein
MLPRGNSALVFDRSDTVAGPAEGKTPQVGLHATTPARSELDDDDPALTVLVPLLTALGRTGGRERKIELRLLVPLPFLFFAFANLFDDERREHREVLLQRNSGNKHGDADVAL